MICEYLMLLLDVVRRRWPILVLPLALAIPAAVFAVKVLPKQYVSKSLVLMQSANQSPIESRNITEQFRAIEAWLKSEHVLNDLLPDLVDTTGITDQTTISSMIGALRASINITPLGGSALEISLTSNKPDGLGRKLETVLARIMESLTGPNRGILNASQFVLLRRSEALRISREKLHKSITMAGLSAPELVESYLKTVLDLNARIETISRNRRTNARAAELADQLTIQKRKTEQLISSDPKVVSSLLDQYAAFQKAQIEFEPLRERLSAQTNNYVGIFDPTSSIVVVGRPKDPIYGRSPAKKIAIAIVFLSMVVAGALVFLLELFYPGVRLRSEFEDLSGVTVIARFPKLSGT